VEDAPSTPLEQQLASIWTELLGQPRVGVQDDFFSAGGNSLKGMQFVSRVQARLGVELALRTLFESPTIAALAGVLARAAPTPGAPPHVSVAAVTDPARPSERPRRLPLLFAQERVWQHEQLAPASAAYALGGAVMLEGALDVPALRRSLADLVQRHDALRATFVQGDGAPVQMIQPAIAVPLEIEPGGVDADVRLRVAEFLQQPFDLETGPLFRARLWRVQPTRHVLSLALHNLVADGWSIDIILRELAQLYAAHATGRAPDLRRLPIAYADAVLADHQQRDDRQVRGVAFWESRLREVRQLDLAVDRPRPSPPSDRGDQVPLHVSAATATALSDLAAREQLTLFVVLLGAVQTLCARYTGQTDILIGSPVANRPRPDLEELVGCFATMVPFRTNLSGNPTMRDLLGRVQESCLDAYAHPELPVETIGRSTPWRVVLTLQPEAHQLPPLHGLTISRLVVPRQTAKVDLAITLAGDRHGLEGALDYRLDVFDPASASRIAGHFTQLLTSMAADPHVRIDAVDFLTPAERRGLRASRLVTALDEPIALG
jgi:aryl carrier-like protein